MERHELNAGIMDLDYDVIDAARLAGCHEDRAREFLAGRFLGRQDIEPRFVGVCDLHILCQNIEPIERCRSGRRDRSDGLILLLCDVFGGRCCARLLFCDSVREVLLAPCFTLLDSLRVGTDCLDVLYFGTGHAHQSLADREDHFTDHVSVFLLDQGVHIVGHGAAERVLLRDHRVIRRSVHHVGDRPIYCALRNHRLGLREEKHSRLFGVGPGRSEVADGRVRCDCRWHLVGARAGSAGCICTLLTGCPGCRDAFFLGAFLAGGFGCRGAGCGSTCCIPASGQSDAGGAQKDQ